MKESAHNNVIGEDDRQKSMLVRELQNMYRRRHGKEYRLTFRGTTCYIRNLEHGYTRIIPNYTEQYKDYLDNFDWLEIPVNMRYAMLEHYALKKIPVPCGCMYQVTPFNGRDSWSAKYVLLKLDHSIYRCTPAHTITGANVYE